jgi:hypothetical protein
LLRLLPLQNCTGPFPLMQRLNLMARVMGTVHRIMTVTVAQHKVGEPRVRAVPILMMHFDPITGGDVQSTSPTCAVLPPQECLFPRRKARIPSQSQAPVGPVPIVGATGSRDFDMARNGRFRMPRKRLGLAKDNHPVFTRPIPGQAPSIPLVMVPPTGPSAELMMHAMIHLRKDTL